MATASGSVADGVDQILKIADPQEQKKEAEKVEPERQEVPAKFLSLTYRDVRDGGLLVATSVLGTTLSPIRLFGI